jgi:CheY-like chemotaxis protein
LASPEVRDRILVEALFDAGLTEIPDDGGPLGAFAAGPLRDAVERTLGEDAAAAVLSDLGPAIRESSAASSGVRRRRGASLAPPSQDAPVVLVASARADHVDALVSRLKERAKVIAAFDLFSLLAAAQRDLRAPLTLLLDDELPAVRPTTLATLARLLPAGSRIVVWGSAGVRPEGRAGSDVEWVHLGPVEDVQAVADVCMAAWAPRRESARQVVLAHEDARWRARVSRMLTDAGYVVRSAPDGFMALEQCLDGAPSAVVAGLAMPMLDGPQLAALLRNRFGDEAPPVLLIADGPLLPDPPAGVVALVRSDAVDQDLLVELAGWIGSGSIGSA